jgi:hypothetical protein
VNPEEVGVVTSPVAFPPFWELLFATPSVARVYSVEWLDDDELERIWKEMVVEEWG